MPRHDSVVMITLATFCLSAVVLAQDLPVSQQCLSCICEATSSCNTSTSCDGGLCGPFGISWGYWVDAGRFTVSGQSFEEPSAFENCGTDVFCSMMTVQGYMRTFKQDCTDDDVIDCDDYVRLHKFGGYGSCKDTPFREDFETKYLHCKDIVGPDI